MEDLIKQNGTTQPKGRPYDRIAPSSVVTCWNPNEDLFGLLFFCYDIRAHTRDVPTLGEGMVLGPYHNEITSRRRDINAIHKYPKGVENFEDAGLFLRTDLDNFLPVLTTFMDRKMAHGSTYKNLPYKPEDFVAYIRDAFAMVKHSQAKLDANFVASHLDKYMSLYLSDRVRAYAGISSWFNVRDFNRVLTNHAPRKGEDAVYIAPSGYIKRDVVALFMQGNVDAQIQIGDDWEQEVIDALNGWFRKGYFTP